MSRNVYLETWRKNEEENLIELVYSDGDIINVSEGDFNRAFGAIVNASKEDVIRDFMI